MKLYRIILIPAGIFVIAAITVGITIGIQKTIHHRKLEKRMPHLAGLLGKERPRDLLKTIKMARVIEVLDLNEEQIGKVISSWRKLDDIRKAHQKERKEKLEKIDELLKAEASTNELENLINDINGLEDKFRSDTQALRNEINTILTLEQQAKLILFERDFHCQMQKFLERQPLRGRRPK